MGKIFDHQWRVVRWTTPNVFLAEVAQCSHFDVAFAAWAAAMTAWPTDEVTLQHGIRVIKRGKAGEQT
ncbi:hypothetical protein [Palleronia sp.]|uniref:hypothetical protein n=1 Tax=Palleronia sp. TaxID=1940284 RepID=UPI0035C85AD8